MTREPLKKFTLRMPRSLFARVEESARREGKSVQKWIEDNLQNC